MTERKVGKPHVLVAYFEDVDKRTLANEIAVGKQHALRDACRSRRIYQRRCLLF